MVPPASVFDLDGKKGLAQASKTGWLYLLDRETGKPLLPIPSYPPFIPLEVTDEHIQAVKELAKAGAYNGTPVKKATAAPT